MSFATDKLQPVVRKKYIRLSGIYTRMLIAKQVGSTMLDGADARVLAVYGAPDRFDRHLRITRMFPFFSRETTVHRSDDYDLIPAEVEAQRKLGTQHQLATLLVGQFVLPIAEDEAGTESDDIRAREVLLRAMDLLNDQNISAKRRAFRTWVAAYEPLQLPDQRKVKEFDELLTQYNAAIRDKRRASRTETAMLVIGTGSSGASIFLPGVGMVGDAVGAIGTIATRYSQPDEWLSGDIRAAALIVEAQKKIRGS